MYAVFNLSRLSSFSNGSLVIRDLADNDEGIYMCTATNNVGSDSVHVSLISREAELMRECYIAHITTAYAVTDT